MEWYYILLISVLAVIILLSCVVMPVLIFCSIFLKRQDRLPYITYFSPEHFGLNHESLNIDYNGEKLYGAVYYKKSLHECKKLILFAHGMGPGHCPYMTEIAFFCNCGYAVAAYDNYGCDRSPGKFIGSTYAGVDALVAAYTAVKQDEVLKNMHICLIGHSLGAYSVLCALERVNVDGVIAISAMDKPVKIVGNGIGLLIQPAFSLLCLIGFGKKAFISSLNCLKASKTPALLIWGEKDPIVTNKESVAVNADGENIQKLILADKRHNPYNTVWAEDKLAELNEKITDKSKINENEKFFVGFDYVAATEEDDAVMQTMVDFIEKI